MFAAFFIRRPIFASDCAILIVLAGGISITTLPVAQYPELSAPQVQVQSVYVGARAQAVESAVMRSLEDAIYGVELIRYQNTNNTNNNTNTITATFDVERYKDLAAVDVQN